MLRAVVSLYREAFSGLSRPVWLLALANLVNRSGTMVLPFMALFLTEDRGFSIPAAGRALALYGIGAMAGSYLGGWLSDRLSPLFVMRGSLLGTAAGFLLISRATSRPALLALLFGVAVVGESFRPAGSAALAGAGPRESRVRAYSLYRLAINMGMSLGPALGGLLVVYGYRWLFLVDGATCALAAGLLWLFFPAGSLAAEPAPHGAPAERSPWRDGPFLGLMVLMLLFATVMFQLSGTYPLMLRDHYGMSEARIGLVMAVNALLVALFEMVVVHSLGHVDPIRRVAVGSALLCMGFGLLPLGSTFAFALLTVVVWTVGEMLAMPAVAGVVADRAGERNRGSYMGTYMLAYAVAFVVAPLAGSWIYARLGPRALWFGCAALGPVLWAAIYALAPALSRGSAGTSGAAGTAAAAPEAS